MLNRSFRVSRTAISIIASGTVATLFGVGILIVGLALAQEDEVAAIDALGAQWSGAYNAGDAEGVANLYTEDAIFSDASGQVIEGRQALNAYMQADIEAGPAQIAIDPMEMDVSNDTAHAIGS